MIDNFLKYSTVFSTENEYDAFFLKLKQSIVKRFSFTIEREVEKVYLLAYWLHIFGRNEEAIIVCNFLLQKEYDGNKRLCQNADTAFFYAQSPDFLKPGLCYYPKFSYL